MHPDHICFPLPLRSTSTLVTSPKTNEGEKKEKKIQRPSCVIHILSGAWTNSQWPVS